MYAWNGEEKGNLRLLLHYVELMKSLNALLLNPELPNVDVEEMTKK
jgi:hypothetical protein